MIARAPGRKKRRVLVLVLNNENTSTNCVPSVLKFSIERYGKSVALLFEWLDKQRFRMKI